MLFAKKLAKLHSEYGYCSSFLQKLFEKHSVVVLDQHVWFDVLSRVYTYQFLANFAPIFLGLDHTLSSGRALYRCRFIFQC